MAAKSSYRPVHQQRSEMTNFSKKMRILSAFLIVIFLTTSCGIYKPVDARKVPVQGDKRARQAIEEGRGISLGNVMKRGTTFEFSTTNPMWRASLDILDFIPLTNADYSGGVIITDWYSTSASPNERCKLNIFISGMRLKTENLKVTSFCQEFKDPSWINKKVDQEDNIKIENAILNKAKKLKLQSS